MLISARFSSRHLLLPVLLLGTLVTHAQTGGVRIGEAGTPDASAVLDIVSSTKGVLLPRVADVTVIANPAAGLMAYQTGGTPGFYYYSGSQWQQVATTATTTTAAATATYGDVKQGLQTADHAGWVKLDGRLTSTLTATQQSRAQALGMTTNLPDATGKVLKQTSGNLLATGGTNATFISQGNLPNVLLRGNTSYDGNHTHTTTDNVMPNDVNNGRYRNNVVNTSTAFSVNSNVVTSSAGGSHSHTVNVALGGSGTALPVEDAYLGVNQFVYLGQ